VWIKTLQVFAVTGAAPDGWAEAFASHPLREPGREQRQTMGFVRPPYCESWVDQVDDRYAFATGVASRHLPKAAIERAVKKRLEEWQRPEPPTKKELDDLWVAVEAELLPQAPVVEEHAQAVYCHRDRLLYVFASNQKGAEALQMTVRHALGSFVIEPIRPRVQVGVEMTRWVREGVPPILELGESMVLDVTEGGTATFRNQDLRAEAVLGHLDAGAVVRRLSLMWNKQLRFEMTDRGELVRIGPPGWKLQPAGILAFWPEVMAQLPSLVADMAALMQARLEPVGNPAEFQAQPGRSSQGTTQGSPSPREVASDPDATGEPESEADPIARMALADAMGSLGSDQGTDDPTTRAGFVPVVMPVHDAPVAKVRELLDRLHGREALSGLVVMRRRTDAYRALYGWANERGLPVTLMDEPDGECAIPAEATAAVCDLRDPVASKVAQAASQVGLRVLRLQPPR